MPIEPEPTDEDEINALTSMAVYSHRVEQYASLSYVLVHRLASGNLDHETAVSKAREIVAHIEK